MDHSLVQIFETVDISDIDVLVNCIRGSKAIFLCVTTGNSVPGCTPRLEEDGGAEKLPRLVMLSLVEAEVKPYFWKDFPGPIRSISYAANSNLYNDLVAVERHLRQYRDWVNFCIVKPGDILWDIARGHEVRFDKQQTFISYTDLAAGMLEVARDGCGTYVSARFWTLDCDGVFEACNHK